MEHPFIHLKGCRQHNLKNISLKLPKDQITVITGVSGSGKSSLAFDTLFAEGQRRYLEHLSPEARASIRQMPKPEIDLIEGISPTLAIRQGKQNLYYRGTVATYTDLDDFFSLLYASVGEQHSPHTGKRLIRYSRQEIIDLILREYALGSKLQLLAPIKLERESAQEAVQRLQKMGFIRIRIGDEEISSEEPWSHLREISQLDVVVDRIEIKEGIRERLSSSVDTAMDLSRGILKVQEGRSGAIRYLTEIYVCPESSFSFAPLGPSDFNFNSPHGACPVCHGEGYLTGATAKELCYACQGARLKSESRHCFIAGRALHEFYAMSVEALLQETSRFHFEGKAALIAKELLPHIESRLRFLEKVGLGYLELNRAGNTLSDGEARRIQLASQIGSKLSGITYVLDEPSLGLHSQDIQRLHQVVKELTNLGNTVIMVEHERSLIQLANRVIDMGPGAGVYGGELLFQGTYDELLQSPHSLTGKWLSGALKFAKPPKRGAPQQFLILEKATLHNLRDFSIKVPLGRFVVLCGVSGSGKSTLAMDLIAEEMDREIAVRGSSPLLKGVESLKRLVTSEKQNEGFSSRSIPATYIGIMTPIRELLAETKLAKARGYSSARFSLNKKGGRCEVCEGLGKLKVRMHLMPDIYIPCEVCQGSRYNYETLQVTWEGQSIAAILELSAQDAYQLFENIPSIAPKLQLMQELGLEYLTLGQPFNTLSSGEIQRLRLVADLGQKSLEPTLYILDEPSAGLHFHDIAKLLKILHRLIDAGHSIIAVEHHLDILRQADWLIEMGPGSGPLGGKVIFEGPLAKMQKVETPTSRFLR